MSAAPCRQPSHTHHDVFSPDPGELLTLHADLLVLVQEGLIVAEFDQQQNCTRYRPRVESEMAA